MATKCGLSTRFSYTAMQNLMDYLVTYNHQSQTIAIDANANDIQSTGGGEATINGVQCLLAADAALDISAEAPYAAWAVSTGYTTAGILSEVTHIDADGQTRHYVCILAHTSYATAGTFLLSDEPTIGVNWATYWRELKKWPVSAIGDTVLTGVTQYYLVCALADGILRIFKAYNAAGTLQIPAYDPTRYVAVGLITLPNTSGSTFTIGTTNLDTLNAVAVYQQLTGFVFPDVTLLEQN